MTVLPPRWLAVSALLLFGCGGRSVTLAFDEPDAGGREPASRDAPDAARPANDAGMCACSTEDTEWRETTFECFCAWFSCPPNLEAVLESLGVPDCDPNWYRYYRTLVLWTYPGCDRLVLAEEYVDGPVASWVFEASTHRLVGASRGGFFGPPICSNLAPRLRGVRAQAPLDASCGEPTWWNVCSVKSDTGADAANAANAADASLPD